MLELRALLFIAGVIGAILCAIEFKIIGTIFCIIVAWLSERSGNSESRKSD